MKQRIITPVDLILVIYVLIIAVLLYVVFLFSLWGDVPEAVEVCVDGKEYGTYNFAEISGTKTVEIKSISGYNILEITNKDARMVDSSCPDGIDIQCGAVSKPGQMIVCAPNKVTVRVLGKDKGNVDRVTY